MLRTTMRFQKPVKSGLPSAVRGGVNVLIFSSAHRWKAVGSSEQPADCPYGRICVGPDPGGGDANGARWPAVDCWRTTTSASANAAAVSERIAGVDYTPRPRIC